MGSCSLPNNLRLDVIGARIIRFSAVQLPTAGRTGPAIWFRVAQTAQNVKSYSHFTTGGLPPISSS
jgi:hypothetical protein